MNSRLHLVFMMAALLSACGNDAPRDPCANPDADGDGHDVTYCGGDDCDDTDARINPSRTEVCDRDNLDEDCDPSTFGERDADRDGAFDARCCNDGNCGEDCDDRRAGIHPTSPEACDESDNDCDGAIDEGVLVTSYVDEDGDGFGTGEPSQRCAGLESYAAIAGDCDDTLTNIHPGAFRCALAADSGSADIEVCAADATWTPASCPALGLCVPQPDATGVCLSGDASPQCADGQDNDGDSLVDFRDPECTSRFDNTEGPLACGDGRDSDGDGLVDFPDDPGCASREDDDEVDLAVKPTCANGLDDDGDGAVDYVRGMGDPGCVSASDASERQADGATCDNGLDDNANGSADFPADRACLNASGDETLPACGNGIDDDLDGVSDFKASGGDPGCASLNDTSERGPTNSNYTCDNGLDDDKDGVADFPGDASCKGPLATEL